LARLIAAFLGSQDQRTAAPRVVTIMSLRGQCQYDVLVLFYQNGGGLPRPHVAALTRAPAGIRGAATSPGLMAGSGRKAHSRASSARYGHASRTMRPPTRSVSCPRSLSPRRRGAGHPAFDKDWIARFRGR
jgi:hypothetical protein